MSRARFDSKFGDDFVSALPGTPGVYRVFSAEGALIYVGKAKNLRRRLGQYRNAKRRKKHHKMRAVVASGHSIEVEQCSSHLDACLLEARLIQEHRPRLNVAGAYHFLYPLVGVREEPSSEVTFCYTTQPERFENFEWNGAYRSRLITREAFHALMDLLEFVGHPSKKSRRTARSDRAAFAKFSSVRKFRCVNLRWIESLRAFFRGESKAALEELILMLVENAGARSRSSEIQEKLRLLSRFYRHEATRLARMRRVCGFTAYPVPQSERDLLWIRSRPEFVSPQSG